MFSLLVFPIIVNAFSNSLEALAVCCHATNPSANPVNSKVHSRTSQVTVDKNPPTNADGLISGPGRSHVLQLKPEPAKSINIKTTTTKRSEALNMA